ncbi:MAG: molybdate ABC transporter permease subunit [Saprospiraceae bacterium]|nr:molybdate ABC transporter permease subunit [Saprospiraceae bacterium]
MEIAPLLLSLRLAVVTTFLLFWISLPLAHWIAFADSRFRSVVQALVALPLVLPPTVLGFYLLVAFSPSQGLGRVLSNMEFPLVFSFSGLVVASLIYSLPFMVQPLVSGFRQLPSSLREASLLMGKSSFTTLIRVLLPSMKGAVLTALVLTFASVIGEFGVVLMIGGNIAGETRVASIALYDRVEALDYAAAHSYALVLLLFSFLALLFLFSYDRKLKNIRS